MVRYLKEEQEFVNFPNLAQNWTINEEERANKVNLEELDKECRENKFKANIEAFYGKQDECEHRATAVTRFKRVSSKQEISEVLCVDCGKFLGIRSRTVRPIVHLEKEQ